MEISELKKLFVKNRELIERTSLSNCHCFGLNSFIINETPRIRLFIAEPDCELRIDTDNDEVLLDYIKNPIIPIHTHKYNDFFIQLEGNLIHYIYATIKNLNEKSYETIPFNTYQYSRLGDETEIKNIGESDLLYCLDMINPKYLSGEQLHTVSIEGDKCSWLIIETTLNKIFNQISYHKDLKKREGLYVPFNNPVDYLMEYFN